LHQTDVQIFFFFFFSIPFWDQFTVVTAERVILRRAAAAGEIGGFAGQ
jgi:hypothetical protein